MDHNEESQVIGYCGECGKKLIANATFCAYCGAPIPKIGGFIPPQANIPYTITNTREVSPPQPFLSNFLNVISTPKEKMPGIASSPNLSQPLLVNIIIGILAFIAMSILIYNSTVSLDASLLTLIPSDELSVQEFTDLFKISIPFSAPIVILLNWLILSLILWILHAFFASDLSSYDRDFKTMATIVGWAQIPNIFHQLVTIVVHYFVLSPGGEINIGSFGQMEITPPAGSSDILSRTILYGSGILFIFWSLVLIYYGIKSLGSDKANPVTICSIYGVLRIVLFFFF